MFPKIKKGGIDQGSLVNLLDKLTGQVFLPVEMFSDVGNAALGAIGSKNRTGMLFDKTTDENIDAKWYPPKDLDVTKAFTIKVLWSSADTAGNDCVWGITYLAAVAGEDMGADGASLTTTDTDSTTSDGLNVSDAITIPANTFASVAELMSLILYRDANAAGDTLDDDAAFYGLLIEYTPYPEVEG